ncbi:helix-turn-helix domain-containing protein [Lentzea sp. BCCO 10_0856]|uniref:Helix-turn-helix domain-containing protein n=1 Tax=Lentzea miocenica TaxID=3095431 RepID=A0ABU4T0Z5_9PSEU|nr:helix-turn-helix domain-containing protein [Lentzea sp. BCCO 10_0856]MDX8031833.1 helix-turn-helix domain-containing protein [Lentzea sp. BCCO 10_0856]
MRATTFSEFLRFYRRRAALTQEDLAARTGLGVRTLSDLERGRVHTPQVHTVDLLVAGLGLDGVEADEFVALARSAEAAQPHPERTDCATPPAGTLVGREPEQQELAECISRAASSSVLDVVVVHGPPGVGKTSLAVDAVHRFAGRFTDSSLHLDLRGMDPTPLSAERAIARLLRAFGVPDARMPSDPGDRVRLYRSMLRERTVLLVLDNAANEAQVRPLLAASPGSLVLVTSRNVLAGLDSRHRLYLGPLRHDGAVALLAATAGADRIQADLRSADLVAGLCGGVPLALAIAGHRLAGRTAWSLRRLAGQLSDERERLDVLATGDVQVRTAFELSYRLLAPGTAAIFRRLALIHGPDTSVALAAVAADVPADEAETLLEELVDASLLRPDVPGRYSFHDLIRDYARERLHSEEPDLDKHRLRTRDWLLTTAMGCASAFLPDDKGASDLASADRWLSAELANWRGAFREAINDEAHEQVLGLARSMHWYSDHRGTGDLWLEVYTAGVGAAGELGELEQQAQQLNFVCWVYVARHTHIPQAMRWHEEALRVARECGSLAETAWAHYYRSAIETRLGDHAEGVAHARRAAELFREAGQPMNVVLALSYSGVLLQRLGRYVDAVETHRTCVAEERTLRGAERGVALENAAQLVLRLADALVAAGDHEAALDAVAEAEALTGRGSANLRSMARLTRGRTLLAAGRLAEAREQLTVAVESLADPEVKVAVLMELAGLCDRVEDRDAAIRHRVRALAESERYESPGMTKLQHEVANALGINVST